MLKEIRIAKEKDCPKMLELLEYICNLHSGIRPDLFKAGKSKYDSERPIIIITTELENPDNASSGVRMWKSSNKTKAHKATTSERILPLTKNTADKAKITNVTTIQPIF